METIKYNNIELFKYLKAEGNTLTYQSIYDDHLIVDNFLDAHCMLDYLQRVIITNLMRKIDFGGK